MRLEDMVIDKKTLVLLSLIVAGCTPSATHFGDVSQPPAYSAARIFAINQDGIARDAVAEALTEAGYIERGDAPLKVEIGFAIRPTELALVSVSEEGLARILSPAAKRSISFCQRQAYVLTLAFVDSGTGEVLSRSGATISRCKGTPSEVLSGLARAALPSPGRGRANRLQ